MEVKYIIIFTLLSGKVSGWSCQNQDGKKFCRAGQSCTMQFNVTAYRPTISGFTLMFYNGSEFGTVAYLGGGTAIAVVNGTNLSADATGNIELTVLNVQMANAGTYYINLIGSQVPCVTLFVYGTPETPVISRDKDPLEGEYVTLTCSSMSGTTPSNHSLTLSYIWRENTTENPVSSRYMYTQSKKNLTISSVVRGDSVLKFSCRATESASGYNSSWSISFSYVVLYGPVAMTLSPGNLSYEREENIELPPVTCNADCNPTCNYTWTRNDTGERVNNISVLQLGTLQASEAGIYRCTAMRPGSAASASKELSVFVIYGPREISIFPSSNPVRQDENTGLASRNCSAKCWQCEYQWSGPGGYNRSESVLDLGILNRSKAGQYTCTATNTKLPSRPHLTSSITIEVRYGPDTVALTPPQVTYTVDENTELGDIVCSATCFPACFFRWNKQGQTSAVSTDGMLPLGIINKQYTGRYTCMAHNTEMSSVESAEASVDIYVRYGPYHESTILSPGQTEHTVNENEVLLNITCQADCYPGCRYTWTKHQSGSDTTISQTAVLSLGRVKRTDAASYRCSVVNPHKISSITTTAEVQIRVNFGPDSSCQQVSPIAEFTEGEDASINCSSDCFPVCLYTWSNASWVVTTGEVLSLGNIRRYQAGNYTFTSRNTAQGKTHQRTFAVIVKYAPVVTAKFSSSVRSEGSNLTLFCEGVGVPATYTYTGLTQTVGTVEVPNRNSAPEGYATNSSIRFSLLQLQDTGNYTCRMNNGIRDLIGTVDQTSSVELLVEVQPKVLQSNMMVAGAEGGSVKVQVPFYSYPAVTAMNFTRNNGLKEANSLKYITSLVDSQFNYTFYGKNVVLGGKTAQMTILSLQEEDFVNYTLTIQNEIGETKVLLMLVAESIPSKPKYFQVLQTSAGLLLIWEKGFNGGNTQAFVIQVSVPDSGKWVHFTNISENDEQNKFNNTFYSANITGLKHGTYTARLISTNKIGNTEPLYLNGTFVVQEKGTTENPTGLIAGAAGGTVGALVVIAFVAVMILIWKRRTGFTEKKASPLESTKNHAARQDSNSDDEDVEIENPMYVSAGPKSHKDDNVYSKPYRKQENNLENAGIYAAVNKSKTAETKKGNDAKRKQMTGDTKNGNDAKRKQMTGEIKKGNDAKRKQMTGGDIYENAVPPSGEGNTYGNPAFEDIPYETTDISARKNRNENKDGLVYADLAFNKPLKGHSKLVVHGADDRTPYAQVDFQKRADPFPDSDNEGTDKSSKN